MIACPVCEDTYFTRMESGDYAESHWVDTAREAQGWEMETQNVMDATLWTCLSGHALSADLSDRLEEEAKDYL